MSKGKLIILEAGDGSGKATQTRLLCKRLAQEGKPARRVEFPDYEAEGSALVRLYLGGAFGKRPEDVNAYAASTFFAVDRFVSYRTKWKDFYEAGGIVLADRYTTSNMVHQAVKLGAGSERDKFLDWLWDFEFQKLGLPMPDRVVFLDMAPDVAARLIDARAKASGQAEDIHEQDKDYLARCYDAYQLLAERYGWKTVRCSEGGEPRPIEAIQEDVWQAVKDIV